MILNLRTRALRLSPSLEQRLRQRLVALSQLQPVSVARVALERCPEAGLLFASGRIWQ